VNKGLEAAAQMLATLHHDSKEAPLLMEEAPPLDPRACNPQFQKVGDQGTQINYCCGHTDILYSGLSWSKLQALGKNPRS
jgi:hypothetical protein